MFEEEDEFLDEAFEASGSNRDEFEDLYKEYNQGSVGGDASGGLGQIFNDRLKKYLEIMAIQNAFNEWEEKALKPGEMERVPNELSEMLTGHKYSGTYAYKLKSGVISKLTLN